MATDFLANAAKDSRPSVSVTGAGQLTQNSGVYALAAALILADTIGLCKLPAGHVPVDFILDSDDLDTDGTPAMVVDVGVIGGDVDALIDGSAVCQAGGLARMDAIAGRRLAPSNVDRVIGVTVVTAPATGATTGTIQGTLISRPANADD